MAVAAKCLVWWELSLPPLRLILCVMPMSHHVRSRLFLNSTRAWSTQQLSEWGFMCICRELCSLAPCRGTSVAKQTRKETKEETNKPEDKQRNKKQETRKESTSKETMKKQGNNGIVNREQETDKETTKHSQAYCKQRGSWPDWPLSTWTQNNSALPSKDGRGAFNRPSAILDSCINKILRGSSHVYTRSLTILRTMWVRMKLAFPRIQW